jgi:hypothetical protein
MGHLSSTRVCQLQRFCKCEKLVISLLFYSGLVSYVWLPQSILPLKSYSKDFTSSTKSVHADATFTYPHLHHAFTNRIRIVIVVIIRYLHFR